jgi:hypothetical protein
MLAGLIVYNIVVIAGAVFLTYHGWWGIALLLLCCLATPKQED